MSWKDTLTNSINQYLKQISLQGEFFNEKFGKKLRKQTLNLCESYPWYKLIFSEKLGKKVQIEFAD